jgi:hypothetical protein
MDLVAMGRPFRPWASPELMGNKEADTGTKRGYARCLVITRLSKKYKVEYIKQLNDERDYDDTDRIPSNTPCN